jgi:hypothetical protein
MSVLSDKAEKVGLHSPPKANVKQLGSIHTEYSQISFSRIHKQMQHGTNLPRRTWKWKMVERARGHTKDEFEEK